MALTLEQAHYAAQITQKKDDLITSTESFIKSQMRKRATLQQFISDNQAMHDSVFGDVADGDGDAELDSLSQAMDSLIDQMCQYTSKTRQQLEEEAANGIGPF